MPLTRAQKKYVAIARAKRRLQHRLDDIDWEMDELAGEVAQLGELEKTQNLEIEASGEDVVDEVQDDA